MASKEEIKAFKARQLDKSIKREKFKDRQYQKQVDREAFHDRQYQKQVQRESFNDKVFAKRVKEFQRQEDIESIHNTGNIFIMIFSIMLLVMMMRVLMNPSAPVPSFASLLEFLQGLSTTSIPLIPTENIGIPFFEYFVSLINVVIFLANGVMQILLFIFTFLFWVLGIV